jgi:hypothetical protein
MILDFITKDDLNRFKLELIEELKQNLRTEIKPDWLKTNDVLALLQCSPGKLTALREKGLLPFKKVGGTYYYNRDDIAKMMA